MLRSISEARLFQGVDVAEFEALRVARGSIIAVEGNTCYRLTWEAPPGGTHPQIRLSNPGGMTGYARITEAQSHGGQPVHLPSVVVKVHFCAHFPCRGKFNAITAEPPHVHLRALSLVEQGAFVDLRSFWRDVIALPIVPLTLETHASRLRASESQVLRLRADQAQLRSARSASVQEAIWELARKWRMLGSHVGLLSFFVWAHVFGRKVIV